MNCSALLAPLFFVKIYSKVICTECGEDVADKEKLPMHLKTVHGGPLLWVYFQNGIPKNGKKWHIWPFLGIKGGSESHEKKRH